MERNWHGIEGIAYQYHGDMADPTISYKGVEWSEWEIQEAVENRMEEEIQSGDIENTTFEKYIQDQRNHDMVKGILDDWMYAQQGPELSEALHQQAASDYYENTEPNFAGALAYDIANAVAENTAKIEQLATTITATLDETMDSVFGDNADAFNPKTDVYDLAELLESEIDISALKKIASEMDISIEQRYSVAVQGGRNGQDGPVYNNLQADELLAELGNLDDGLFAVAVDSDGIVFKDMINEETLETLKNNLIEKGEYIEPLSTKDIISQQLNSLQEAISNAVNDYEGPAVFEESADFSIVCNDGKTADVSVLYANDTNTYNICIQRTDYMIHKELPDMENVRESLIGAVEGNTHNLAEQIEQFMYDRDEYEFAAQDAIRWMDNTEIGAGATTENRKAVTELIETALNGTAPEEIGGVEPLMDYLNDQLHEALLENDERTASILLKKLDGFEPEKSGSEQSAPKKSLDDDFGNR